MTPSLSNSASREMPIIARRSPSNDTVLLPKRTSQRRSLNYESVIVAPPFFSKSKSSAPHRRPDNERRHSATTGQRETGDLRRMEHYSTSPRCCLPKSDGDRGYSNRPLTGNAVLRSAAAVAHSLNSQSSSPPTEIAGNNDDDDATPRQRTGHQGRVANGNERKPFLGGEEAKEKESVRKTDRFTESDDGTERSSSVTALPRFPSSSNGELSFGGIVSISLPPSPDDLGISHSTRHSSDNRTSGPASRDTDTSLLRSKFDTTEAPACISKISDSLTDAVLMDNATLSSKADTLNEDEIKYNYKASGDNDDFIPKTNSACRVETKKYHSDIRIKLKEAEPVDPVSYRSREVARKSNGDVPGVSSSSSEEREAEEESEIVETVTPNWSSYPGPLPDASTAHESEDEEAIDAICRNTSATEVDVICAEADAEAKYDKLSSNADYSAGEISTPSTKADDCQTSRTNTKGKCKDF